MIVARALYNDPYWSLLGLSLFVSALTLGLMAWRPAWPEARPEPFFALVAGLLALSKSFVEFSCAGLENPLSHLLIVLSWRETIRKSPSLLRASVWLGLAALNRLDLLLLFAPPWLLLAHQARKAGARLTPSLLAACLPLLAWELFSLAYYGSFVPNTALAKLGLPLPRTALIAHGWASFSQPALHDPLSILLLVSGLTLGLWRGTRPLRALCAGAALYLAYLVWIGGDFMAGRFLSAPVLVSVLSLLEVLPVPQLRFQLALAALAVWLETRASNPIWRAAVEQPANPLELLPTLNTCMDGVCDERAYYAPYTNWRHLKYSSLHPPHPWAVLGKQIAEHPELTRVSSTIGFRGYFAGPRAFIVDQFGLSDPLIARIPAKLTWWKPGHFRRCLPLGYLEATRTGPDALLDPPLRDYYRKVWLVTRAPLWSAARWRTIFELSTTASRFSARYGCRVPTSRDERE
jgi:arabinofuranosyltransferase